MLFISSVWLFQTKNRNTEDILICFNWAPSMSSRGNLPESMRRYDSYHGSRDNIHDDHEENVEQSNLETTSALARRNEMIRQFSR